MNTHPFAVIAANVVELIELWLGHLSFESICGKDKKNIQTLISATLAFVVRYDAIKSVTYG